MLRLLRVDRVSIDVVTTLYRLRTTGVILFYCFDPGPSSHANKLRRSITGLGCSSSQLKCHTQAQTKPGTSTHLL